MSQAQQDLVVLAMGILTGAQEQIQRLALDDARMLGTTIIKIDMVSAGDGTLRVEVLDPFRVVIRDPAKETQ